jgi:hypothetical protein
MIKIHLSGSTLIHKNKLFLTYLFHEFLHSGSFAEARKKAETEEAETKAKETEN